MKLALVTLAGLAGALSIAASSPPSAQQHATPVAAKASASTTCFRARDIRNHTLADDRTLYIDVGGRAVYRVTTRGACLAGASSSDPIITREPPGSTLVCKPIDMDLAIGHTGGRFVTPCIVDSLTRLTPAEVAALPRKLKP